MWPLKRYLEYRGHGPCHLITYDPDSHDNVEAMVNEVDREMRRHANVMTDRVSIVGQSMGGVVANRLHRAGWDIDAAVYIGSPLHGARFINTLEQTVPRALFRWLNKPPYDYLRRASREQPPPHPYRTISMAWPFINFDGCVHRDEATLDTRYHTHLQWADHRTVFANPRLWITVNTLLEQARRQKKKSE